MLMTDSKPSTLPWQPGPAQGNDPLERGEVECSDQYLVATRYYSSALRLEFWHSDVIVSGESGWKDANGNWSDVDWSSVEWFIKLDDAAMPPTKGK